MNGQTVARRLIPAQMRRGAGAYAAPMPDAPRFNIHVQANEPVRDRVPVSAGRQYGTASDRSRSQWHAFRAASVTYYGPPRDARHRAYHRARNKQQLSPANCLYARRNPSSHYHASRSTARHDVSRVPPPPGADTRPTPPAVALAPRLTRGPGRIARGTRHIGTRHPSSARIVRARGSESPRHMAIEKAHAPRGMDQWWRD